MNRRFCTNNQLVTLFRDLPGILDPPAAREISDSIFSNNLAIILESLDYSILAKVVESTAESENITE